MTTLLTWKRSIVTDNQQNRKKTWIFINLETPVLYGHNKNMQNWDDELKNIMARKMNDLIRNNNSGGGSGGHKSKAIVADSHYTGRY